MTTTRSISLTDEELAVAEAALRIAIEYWQDGEDCAPLHCRKFFRREKEKHQSLLLVLENAPF